MAGRPDDDADGRRPAGRLTGRQHARGERGVRRRCLPAIWGDRPAAREATAGAGHAARRAPVKRLSGDGASVCLRSSPAFNPTGCERGVAWPSVVLAGALGVRREAGRAGCDRQVELDGGAVVADVARPLASPFAARCEQVGGAVVGRGGLLVGRRFGRHGRDSNDLDGDLDGALGSTGRPAAAGSTGDELAGLAVHAASSRSVIVASAVRGRYT